MLFLLRDLFTETISQIDVMFLKYCSHVVGGGSLLVQFKTTIITKLTFLLAGSQWEIYEKLTKIRRLHGIVTRVLYTQFT